jgi:type IV pilus assembly protein PilY1
MGNVVSEKLNSPAVGYNLIYDQEGNPVVAVVEADDPTPHLIENKDIARGGSNRNTLLKRNEDNTYGRKYIWRELTPNSGNN